MKTAIEVKEIWKEYLKTESSGANLRETLLRMPRQLFKTRQEKFYALQNVNFSLEKGESIALVGKNGAGKSTMLKILARITPPTRGECIIYGKIASLLEVGTGFHPELTGRENIFLNGSILGMKKNDINARFDEIVEFSGVASFIDTQLKKYSSGMQMRLAFSVAAFLNADILLIDEVFGVGDTEFQQKSLEKLRQISQDKGKSVIFVSHDLDILSKLTTRGILLQDGCITADTDIHSCISKYRDSF